MTIRSPRRTSTAIPILIALAAILLTWVACVEDEGSALDQLTLRDALGTSPGWMAPQEQEARDRLQERLTDAITAQAEDSAWVELLPEDAARFDSDNPQTAVARLDQRLLNLQREPLLVQWNVIDEEGPGANACPISAEDLAERLPDGFGAKAAGWDIDERFERPLGADGALTERDALLARLPRVETWVERCAGAAGPDLAPEGADTRMLLVRAESAPTLLAFHPQARVVLINPLLLTLFAPPPDALRVTRHALIPSHSLEVCIAAVGDYCDRCGDLDSYDADSTCVEALLNAPSPRVACANIAGVELGPAQFCVNHLLFNQRTLDICVDNTTTSPSCALEGPTRSFTSLEGRYLTFVQNPVCLDALDTCLDEDVAEPDPYTPTTPPPPPEDDESCGDAIECAGVFCEVCAESGALDGACEDVDCGDTDCEGSDCEGSDCGGCEGDTY